MILIPYSLTFLTGIATLCLVMKDRDPLPGFLFTALSAVTGISITIFVTFFSFAFLNRFHLLFIILAHLIYSAALLIYARPKLSLKIPRPSFPLPAMISCVFLVGILSLLYAKMYPMGGWDAWLGWNFKARFLLLADTRWKELFDPVFWRFHPHYPIGFPLFNAWTMAFTEGTSVFAPLANAVLFNILTACLLIGLLEKNCSSYFFLLPIAVIFTSPLHMIFMTNQYCDVVIGLFLLAGIGTLIEAQRRADTRFLILCGMFLGTLSFLKLEGAVLAVLLFIGAHCYFPKPINRKTLAAFWMSALISALPMILFLLFVAPSNQSFINGLTSAEQPSTLARLQIVLIAPFREMISMKWRFLWWGLLLVGVMHAKAIFKKELLIFPFIFVFYLGAVSLHYWINTYFPIHWLIDLSITRILGTLLPSIILWICLGMFPKKSSG